MAATIQIHGKAYTPVAERVRLAHNDQDDALQSIITEAVQVFEDGGVVFRAVVTFTSGRAFSGHAYESPKSKAIAGQAPWEVAETSAVGRALGFAGYGSEEGIASAEEEQSKNTTPQAPRSAAPAKPAAPPVAPTQAKPANGHGHDTDARAMYARLFKDCTDLGITPIKGEWVMPAEMPDKATAAQVQAAVDFLRGLVFQAEDMKLQPA